MASLVQKVLFPMDLKRYMVLSFATLWTLVLIIALIATLIHQTNYQKSASQLNLQQKVASLTQALDTANFESEVLILAQKEEIIALQNAQGLSCLWDE